MHRKLMNELCDYRARRTARRADAALTRRLDGLALTELGYPPAPDAAAGRVRGWL